MILIAIESDSSIYQSEINNQPFFYASNFL